jgi:threonine dehydrogenase-like Zn-dependent dehydrogenase
MTQRTETTPEPSGPSTGTIALFAIAAIAVVGIVIYMVSNRNAERAADRNANLTAAAINSNQQVQPPPTIIQQPAAQPQQQAPVIIQQAPAQPQQQPPVIIQQSAPPPARDVAGADATVQEAAIRKLSESDGMALVTIRVSGGTATLSGSATSAALKSQAERVVRNVRGVTAVDNQITVSSL